MCAVDPDKNAQLVIERIYPDLQHSSTVVPKLEAFWRICILPEILGRWFTRRSDVHISVPSDNGICFSRGQHCDSDHVVLCSNVDCPYSKFHIKCLSLNKVPILKTWYRPHCSRLPQFKLTRGSTKGKQVSSIQAAMLCSGICIAILSLPQLTDYCECHGTTCRNGHFFHLSCLGLKRMPNNSKTTWQCEACRKKQKPNSKFVKPITCTSSASCSYPVTPVATASVVSSDSSSGSEDEIYITFPKLQELLTNLVP